MYMFLIGRFGSGRVVNEFMSTTVSAFKTDHQIRPKKNGSSECVDSMGSVCMRVCGNVFALVFPHRSVVGETIFALCTLIYGRMC